MSSRRWMTLGATSAMSLCVSLAGCERQHSATVDANSIQAVELRERLADRTIVAHSTTDPSVIAATVATLNGGAPVEWHKCAATAWLRLLGGDGGVREFEIVAGHEEGFAEVREAGRMFQMSRRTLEESLNALRAAHAASRPAPGCPGGQP